MNLVKTTNNSYINMDTIESIFENVKKDTYGITIIKCVRCTSGKVYDISKETFETLLKYGNARI